jgi:hypothetical protein
VLYAGILTVLLGYRIVRTIRLRMSSHPSTAAAPIARPRGISS